MTNRLFALAIPAIAALGMSLAAVAPSAAAMPRATTAVHTVDAAGAQVVPVRDHWRHRHGRHHRHWRRHHRGYYRPGPGVYLGFGAPYYRPPVYYGRPRYAAPRYRHLSRAHIRWCYNRYRSYRASDNTFQPYHGPRRQCRSPYY